MERALGVELEGYLSELAHHFFQAAPAGDADKAVEYARRAGDRALAVLAYEEAVRLYGMALQALDLKGELDEEMRCELLLALGEAQMRTGDTPKAQEAFRRGALVARMSGTPEQMARAAIGFGGRFVWGGDDADIPELAGLLKEALRALRKEDSVLGVKVLARLAGAFAFTASPKERETFSQEAVEMARRLGDLLALAYALDIRFWAIYSPENVDERLALATELIEVAEKVGDKERAHQGYHWRMLVFLELCDMEAADRDIEAQVRLAQELRQPSQLMYTEAVLATRATFQGRLEEGERLAQQAMATGQQSDKQTAFNNFAVQMFGLRDLRGQLNEGDAEALKATVGQFLYQPAWRCGLANTYAELGREAEARLEFEQLAAASFSELPRDPQWFIAVALLCQVCTYLGDAQRADILYTMLSPYSSRNVLAPPALCVGSVARYLGLLAATMRRYKEASRHFEDALEMNERMGARPWVAHTQHDYGKMLLARGEPGDREKAQALLAQALQTARELGMKKLEADAEAIMPSAPVAAGAFRTVLFTDLEGSTALTERLGDAKARNVLREHESITRQALRAHGGSEIKTMGDGFMASFGAATQALECAIAIQKAFAARNQSASEPILVHIGMNAGEPVADDEDLFGTAVNLAARIAGQARGDVILVSDVVRQLVAGKGFAFADGGATTLKGFEDPVRVFSVRWREDG